MEAELGDHGRVLVRASGTEPLVRVMVEAPTAEQAESGGRSPGGGDRRPRGRLSPPVGFGGCAASSPSSGARAPGRPSIPLTVLDPLRAVQQALDAPDPVAARRGGGRAPRRPRRAPAVHRRRRPARARPRGRPRAPPRSAPPCTTGSPPPRRSSTPPARRRRASLEEANAALLRLKDAALGGGARPAPHRRRPSASSSGPTRPGRPSRSAPPSSRRSPRSTGSRCAAATAPASRCWSTTTASTSTIPPSRG